MLLSAPLVWISASAARDVRSRCGVGPGCYSDRPTHVLRFPSYAYCRTVPAAAGTAIAAVLGTDEGGASRPQERVYELLADGRLRSSLERDGEPAMTTIFDVLVLFQLCARHLGYEIRPVRRLLVDSVRTE